MASSKRVAHPDQVPEGSWQVRAQHSAHCGDLSKGNPADTPMPPVHLPTREHRAQVSATFTP